MTAGRPPPIPEKEQAEFTQLLEQKFYQSMVQELALVAEQLRNAGFAQEKPRKPSTDPRILAARKLKDNLRSQLQAISDINNIKNKYKTIEELKTAIEQINKSISELSGGHISPEKKALLATANSLLSATSAGCSIPTQTKNLEEIFYKGEKYEPPAEKKIGWFEKLLQTIIPSRAKKAREKQRQAVRDYDEQTFLVKIKAKINESTTNKIDEYYNTYFKDKNKSLKETAKRIKERPKTQKLKKNKNVSPAAPPPPTAFQKATHVAWYAGGLILSASTQAGKVGYDVASQYIADKVGLERDLAALQREQDTTLNDHIKMTFDRQLRAEAFDTLIEFTRSSYEIMESCMRFDSMHQKDLPQAEASSLKSLGFGRLEEPEFKIFLINILRNLGFQISDQDTAKDLVSKLITMDPAELETVRTKFIQASTKESKDGMARVKQLIFDEYHHQASKGSPNYLGLLHYQSKALEKIESYQRIPNAMVLIPNLDEYINYNPVEQRGIWASLKGAIRNLVISNLPTGISYALAGVHQERMEANQKASEFAAAIKRKQEEWLQGAMPTTVDPAQEARQQAWAKAQTKAERKSLPQVREDGDNLDKTIMGEFEKTWQEFDLKLLSLLNAKSNEEDKKLLLKIDEELNKEIERLKLAQSSRELIQEATKQRELFQACILHNTQDIKTLDVKELQKLSLGITQALRQIVQENKFDNVDAKQKAILFHHAFNNIGSPLSLPQTLMVAYKDILLTDRSKIGAKEWTEFQKFIISAFSERLSIYVNEVYAEPLQLLEYHLQQKRQGYTLATSAAPSPPLLSPAPQGSSKPASEQTWGEYFYSWGSWAAENISAAASTVASYAWWAAGWGTWLADIAAKATYSSANITYNSLNNWWQEKSHDPASFNKIVLQSAQVALREQAFDHYLKMAAELASLRKTLTPEESKSLGLERLRKGEFLDTLAENLGFKGTDTLSPADVLLKAIENKDESLIKIVREQFIQLPNTEEAKKTDLFAALKQTIADENSKVVKLIKSEKLPHSANYVAIISAMNNLNAQLTMLQRMNVAAQIYGPHIGIDPAQKGFMSQIKAATLDEVASRVGQGVNAGIQYYIKDAVTQATSLTHEVVAAASEKSAQQAALAPSTSKIAQQPPITHAFSSHQSKRQGPTADEPQPTSALSADTKGPKK